MNAPEKCYVGAENLNREVLFRIINIQIDGYTQSSIFCVAPLAWVYSQIASVGAELFFDDLTYSFFYPLFDFMF